ncbi:hypothetical protein F4805DRAFT_439126 [Annulohypoxylon moriforme]|nr:hypothetical protein F4805DRAFT_439126 [Annulohypoxylon moriforme]
MLHRSAEKVGMPSATSLPLCASIFILVLISSAYKYVRRVTFLFLGIRGWILFFPCSLASMYGEGKAPEMSALLLVPPSLLTV